MNADLEIKRAYKTVQHRHPLTPERLAALAAPLVAARKGNLEAAMDDAVRLWVACAWKVEELSSPIDPLVALCQGVPVPPRPDHDLSFKEMLRWMMPAWLDSEGKREAKYKEYLAAMPLQKNGKPARPAGRGIAAQSLATDKDQTFKPGHCLLIAQDFLRWWGRRKHDQATENGAKGGRPKRGD